jgi:hypothetical protein
MMKNYAHKIGAVFYVLWGILHIIGGISILAAESPNAQLAMFGTAVPADLLPANPGEVVHAALSFHAFNLAWFGVFALLVGVLMNWRNSRLGYWLNFGVVAVADIGLFIFLILPGHMALADGSPGPVLWILALIFSTIGILKGESKPTMSAA